MEVKGFYIERSWVRPMKRLSDEQRGRLLGALCDWAFGSPEVRVSVEEGIAPDIAGLFDVITSSMLDEEDRRARKCERLSRNASRRWGDGCKSMQKDAIAGDGCKSMQKDAIASEIIEKHDETMQLHANASSGTPPFPPVPSPSLVPPQTPSLNSSTSIPPISPVEGVARARAMTPPMDDLNSFFYISSVERSELGHQPEAIAGAKRARLRQAAEKLAASGDPRYAITPAMLTRFVLHWGARLRSTDRIRAEEDVFFSLPDKLEAWVSGDRDRKGITKDQAPAAPMDVRPISERLINHGS